MLCKLRPGSRHDRSSDDPSDDDSFLLPLTLSQLSVSESQVIILHLFLVPIVLLILFVVDSSPLSKGGKRTFLRSQFSLHLSHIKFPSLLVLTNLDNLPRWSIHIRHPIKTFKLDFRLLIDKGRFGFRTGLLPYWQLVCIHLLFPRLYVGNRNYMRALVVFVCHLWISGYHKKYLRMIEAAFAWILRLC